MSRDYIIQYAAVAAAVTALVIDRKNNSKYVPAALFASLYANLWCYIAMYFDLWTFPVRLLPFIGDISFIVNMISVPTAAIIWIKHIPPTFWGKALWALLWAGGITGGELILERFTDIVEYHNGYDWYHSLVLWFVSWYIWSAFHKWQIRKILDKET